VAGKRADTHFSRASSLVVRDPVLEIFLKDVTDVQRFAFFVQSCDKVMYDQHNLFVLTRRQRELGSSN